MYLCVYVLHVVLNFSQLDFVCSAFCVHRKYRLEHHKLLQ